MRDYSLTGDWFVPLNDLYPAELIDQMNKTYLPGCAESMKLQGIWYGLPWRADTRGMLINADIFEAAGLSASKQIRYIDELDEIAKKLTVIKPDGSVEMIGFVPYGNNFSREIPWLWALGGDFFDYENLAPAFTGVNLANNLEALNWIKWYADQYGPTTQLSENRFLSQKAAMYVNSTTFLAKIRENAPNLNYTTGVIPTKRGAELFSTTFPLGPSIPLGASHPNEAAEFIRYLMNIDVQVQWFEETRALPTTAEAFIRIYPKITDPKERFMVETMLPVSRVMPPLSTDILNIFQPLLDKMRKGELTPLQVLEDTQMLSEAFFAEYLKK